jgi:hypothetical protein
MLPMNMPLYTSDSERLRSATGTHLQNNTPAAEQQQECQGSVPCTAATDAANEHAAVDQRERAAALSNRHPSASIGRSTRVAARPVRPNETSQVLVHMLL